MLALYQRFGGDVDARSRLAPGTHAQLTDEAWALIDELRMQIRVANSGRASAAFIAALDVRLRDEVADDDTRAALQRLAGSPPVG